MFCAVSLVGCKGGVSSTESNWETLLALNRNNKKLLGISCDIWGPFVFVRRLLNTLLMCFQSVASGFSLKAEIHPNYSHLEVSFVVKTFSHGAATVTHIHLNNSPPLKLQPNCSTLPTNCIDDTLCVLHTYVRMTNLAPHQQSVK